MENLMMVAKVKKVLAAMMINKFFKSCFQLFLIVSQEYLITLASIVEYELSLNDRQQTKLMAKHRI
jgi:aspartyl aminopeptidase